MSLAQWLALPSLGCSHAEFACSLHPTDVLWFPPPAQADVLVFVPSVDWHSIQVVSCVVNRVPWIEREGHVQDRRRQHTSGWAAEPARDNHTTACWLEKLGGEVLEGVIDPYG
ncbi:uncharacterized [Tachysurus ichikawai]